MRRHGQHYITHGRKLDLRTTVNDQRINVGRISNRVTVAKPDQTTQQAQSKTPMTTRSRKHRRMSEKSRQLPEVFVSPGCRPLRSKTSF